MRLMAAVERVCAAGVLTPDVGGKATTKEVTDAVIDAINGSNA
jgi:tartrate dehydrogenase/decarboxylase/D-malate dehydrogenase